MAALLFDSEALDVDPYFLVFRLAALDILNANAESERAKERTKEKQTSKLSILQMLKCTNAQVHKCQMLKYQMDKSTSAQMPNAQILKAKMLKCTNAKCSFAVSW